MQKMQQIPPGANQVVLYNRTDKPVVVLWKGSRHKVPGLGAQGIKGSLSVSRPLAEYVLKHKRYSELLSIEPTDAKSIGIKAEILEKQLAVLEDISKIQLTGFLRVAVPEIGERSGNAANLPNEMDDLRETAAELLRGGAIDVDAFLARMVSAANAKTPAKGKK